MDDQMFRFCCRCARVSLISPDTGCYFCGGKFVLASLKDDLKLKRKKEVAESHYSIFELFWL